MVPWGAFSGALVLLDPLCSVCVRGHDQSCRTLFNPKDYNPPGSSVHFPGKNTGVGCHFLLQGSSHPRDQTHVSWISCIDGQIFYHLSQLGSPCCVPLSKIAKAYSWRAWFFWSPISTSLPYRRSKIIRVGFMVFFLFFCHINLKT